MDVRGAFPCVVSKHYSMTALEGKNLLGKYSRTDAREVVDIDWTSWNPVDVATLVFVVREGQILLIHKKRGLGAGKVNGPGGRLEPGELPEVCARRELREELSIDTKNLVRLGDHRFQFSDGYSIYVHVYRTGEMTGTAMESGEAVPMWVSVDKIPFEEMWEDDRYWLPLLLQGRHFSGYWVFDGDRMLDHRLHVYD